MSADYDYTREQERLMRLLAAAHQSGASQFGERYVLASERVKGVYLHVFPKASTTDLGHAALIAQLACEMCEFARETKGD